MASSLAGLAGPTPALGQGQRAWVVARRQAQREAAQHRVQVRFGQRGLRRGTHAPAGEGIERLLADQGIVTVQVRAFGRGQRHFQCDQLAAVGRFDLDLVVVDHRRRARTGARAADRARPADRGPGASVEVPEHVSAPVHLRLRRRFAEEGRAQRRGVVGDQVDPVAGRHPVGQAGLGQRTLGHAPQWRSEAREQPEHHHRQRQADRDHARHHEQARPRPPRRRARVAFDFRQRVQRGQRGHRAGQTQRQRHRALVEQEGREGREQRETQQAARVAQRAHFHRLEREHRRQHRAAGVAAEAEFVQRHHSAEQCDDQQEAQPGRRMAVAREKRHRQRDRADAEGQRVLHLQQQRQQAQQRRRQRPAAGQPVQWWRDGLSHGRPPRASAPAP